MHIGAKSVKKTRIEEKLIITKLKSSKRITQLLCTMMRLEERFGSHKIASQTSHVVAGDARADT